MGWKRWLAPPLALASGVVWALCFGRQPLLVAPWLALVPFFLVVDRGRPGFAGFLFGLGYWLSAIPWIQPTLATYGGLPPSVATIGLVAAAAYLALYSAVFGVVAARLGRRGTAIAAIGWPAAWVALETLRGLGPLAFPWNLAAYAVVDTPGALELTAGVGSWGLSFLVVAVNGALALALRRRDGRPAGIALAAAGVLLGGAFLAAPPLPEPRSDAPRARLLQPDSPIRMDFDAAEAGAGYRRLIEQSKAACAAGPALVVWPESAAWPFSYQRHEAVRRDVGELSRRGCPVLLNSTSRDGEAVYNSVYLVTAGRPDQRYDKELLVPFGETVPFARWLPGMRVIARNAGGFSPGRGNPLLEWGGERLGPSICFEIVFPGRVASQVRRGSTLLVTVTNDGWYGDSSAPWQHFRAARFRAAENRRPVLRAAITGVSGVIAADGSVESLLGVGERGMLETAVAGGRARTFFSRFPWAVPALCWALLPFVIFRRGRD